MVTAFADALCGINDIIARDASDPAIDPRCLPRIAHHGDRTKNAIVLFHGFTNCPIQFSELGDRFFERGYTVYIPRLPHHGLADKMTRALEALTLAELEAAALQAVTLATGLGARVATLGISMGGTMAAWTGETQPIDTAVAIAPFFGIKLLPVPFEDAFSATLAALPNADMWWDPIHKEQLPPPHGYPRFPTHALAQCLKMGEEIAARAKKTAPLGRRNILVLNDHEPAVSNDAARDVWSSWRAYDTDIEEIVLRDLDVRHDIIEPTTYPQARTLVYPTLVAAVDHGTPNVIRAPEYPTPD
jgi:pimeloyl-ACP methyl ester carboxylesterase